MLRQPVFDTLKKGMDYRVIGDLPNTDKIMNDSFWIGVYPGMKHESIEYIVKMIRDFVKKYD
jgi:CDP-6-deoxy-D-xylo-4-hexulose-3-dehydrase